MAKYRYFDVLEALAADMSRAVSLACGGRCKNRCDELNQLRRTCDKKICELEDALFADFLPPLERDNIAACAHGMSRVIDRAVALSATHGGQSSLSFRPDEGELICRQLAGLLCENVALLRNIRKPSEMPTLRSFRELLGKGRACHAERVRRSGTGSPQSASVLMCGRLLQELSDCFDELVEIMLNNI